MKKYRIYASQTVYYSKIVEADSLEDAEEIVWDSDFSSWSECNYGDWELEDATEELENELINA